MTAAFQRLRRMSREETVWRLRTLARTHGQRLVAAARGSQWARADIRDALSDAVLDESMRQTIERGDWLSVHDRLRAGLRLRPSRFILDPHSATAMRREIRRQCPGAVTEARRRAGDILEGRFDVLGYKGLRFADANGEIDWHLDPVSDRHMPRVFWSSVPYLDPRCGDHKVVWEINRHQYWLALGRALWLTGDSRYGDAIVRDLQSWMRANPPLIGTNWASMLELSFRAIAWTWATHALIGSPYGDPGSGDGADDRADREPWLLDMLLGLDRQLTHVAHNLSVYFSPNTHLTGEALALYVIGYALPELRRSTEWIDIGRRVLLAEIGRQICADGGHAERSAHYHRYTLDFYLLALLTAEHNGDEAAGEFADAVSRLATCLAALADDRGYIPQIGDDDGGMLWPMTGREPRDVRDSLTTAALVLGRPELARWDMQEEALWTAWTARREEIERWRRAGRTSETGANNPSCATAVFAQTGYVAIRDARKDHLVLDAGPHGYLNGGHAHADALAITLAVGGQPLLIDGGTATYTANPALRDRMRRTASHNTLTLNGRSSAEAAGSFHWRTRADAELHAVRCNDTFAWTEASHDGFDAVRHRRSVVHALGSGWLVVDEVLGGRRQRADLHWHFDPSWTVTCDDRDCLRATHRDGRVARVVHDGGELLLVSGDEESGLGWCSPVYGSVVPTWTARITRTAIAPFAMVTWIGDGDATVPRLGRIPLDPDPNGAAVGIRVVRDTVSWSTMLRPGESGGCDTRSCGTPEYQTNARLLQYAVRGGRVLSITLADFTELLATREGLLSITADEPTTEVSVAIENETLTLVSSGARSALRLHGELARQIRAIRVNGVERGRLQGSRPDTIEVPAGWWETSAAGDRTATCVA